MTVRNQEDSEIIKQPTMRGVGCFVVVLIYSLNKYEYSSCVDLFAEQI